MRDQLRALRRDEDGRQTPCEQTQYLAQRRPEQAVPSCRVATRGKTRPTGCCVPQERQEPERSQLMAGTWARDLRGGRQKLVVHCVTYPGHYLSV